MGSEIERMKAWTAEKIAALEVEAKGLQTAHDTFVLETRLAIQKIIQDAGIFDKIHELELKIPASATEKKARFDAIQLEIAKLKATVESMDAFQAGAPSPQAETETPNQEAPDSPPPSTATEGGGSRMPRRRPIRPSPPA